MLQLGARKSHLGILSVRFPKRVQRLALSPHHLLPFCLGVLAPVERPVQHQWSLLPPSWYLNEGANLLTRSSSDPLSFPSPAGYFRVAVSNLSSAYTEQNPHPSSLPSHQLSRPL
jgi:hypothetical protein